VGGRFSGETKSVSGFERMRRFFGVSSLNAVRRARSSWAAIFLGVGALAWFSGMRVFYLAAAVLLGLPVLSYAISKVALKIGVRISCNCPPAVTKNQPAKLTAAIHNRTPLPFSAARILILADEDAIYLDENEPFYVPPFGRVLIEIPFEVEFCGHFSLGPGAISISDMTGLTRLKKIFHHRGEITSLPLVADVSSFPIAANLTMQESSTPSARHEDFMDVSDIRRYVPTDSIKRVHWKLTAKRSEWLVKNFQAGALNKITIILDLARPKLPTRESYALTDAIVENALGLAKFCLSRNMPIEFIAGEKTVANSIGEFQTIYDAASALRIMEDGANCAALLNHAISDGSVNAVIFTPNITPQLFECAAKAKTVGHSVSVMYFHTQDAPPGTHPQASSRNRVQLHDVNSDAEILAALSEIGVPVVYNSMRIE